MRRLRLPALLLLLYLPALGNPASGTHPDESYYLGISAEMDAHGAWLTPTIDGQARWFKPPLLYWAERVCYGLLGRNFLAARLPVALAAVGLALVTASLGRRLYGERAGTLAALLVATAFGWLKFGRIAMMDAPMALGLAVAALGAWMGAEEDRPRALLLCGLGAGVTFMLKGPVGAVLVLLVAGGFLAARRPRLLLSRHTALAFLLGAAIGLPWYAASLAVHGRRFYEFFVVEQNLDRFRHPWTWDGEATLVVGLLVFLLPWTPLALAGLGGARRWREPAILLPLIWIAAVLLTFSIPSLKWPHYGLACSPAFALLAAREPPPRWARLLTAAGLAAMALLAAGMMRWGFGGVVGAALVTVVLGLGAGALLVGRGALTAGAGAVGLAFALALAVIVPTVNPQPFPAEARAAVAGERLFLFDNVPGVATLAAGRAVHRVDAQEVEGVLREGGVVIVPARGLERLPPEGLRTLARWKRLRPYLPPGEVIRSYLAGDPSVLFEPMLAVKRAG